MRADALPVIATKTGFLRLRVPLTQDWSGTIHVTGDVNDPAGSLVVSISSDAAFRDTAVDVLAEESDDGVHWTASARPVQRIVACSVECRTAAPSRRRRN